MIRFENVTYTYPFSASPAVRGINFSVRPGELVLVTGRSGCGKTTLMRLANGLCPGYFQGNLEGSVSICGKSTRDIPLKDMSRLVGTLFQDPEQQFFALGVEDELAFAHEWQGLPSAITEEKILASASSFGILPILKRSVFDLSEGQKQKVALASIMSQAPSALILDEPTANLDPESTMDLARRLNMLKKSGMAILVVDHRLYWLEGVADRILVMKEGEVCAMGSFGILKDDSLRRSCGLRHWHVNDPRPLLPEATASGTGHGLSIKKLTFAYKGQKALFQDASLYLPPGVTALIGANGTGKTTLSRLITGLNKAQSGMFFLNGEGISPSELIHHTGIVLQNADHQLHMKTVEQELELCFSLATKLKKSRLHASREGKEQIHGLLSRFGMEHLAQRHPQSLSGGEKQRLVIACAIAKEPDILILDEPTSGLDGDNMARIGHALQELSRKGTIILVITHDLELMDLACSRILHLPSSEKNKDSSIPHYHTPKE